MLNRSDSVCVDILTYEDLIQLRTRSKRRHDDVFTSTSTSKRYLILTYAAEFDRVCYPLPLCPETEPDTAAMQRTILRLRHEIEMLRLGTTNNRHGTNSTSYDVLKVEYNELQAAHESLMHETESRIQSLREENERLREEISVFRCEEAAEPAKKSNMIVTLKRRLRATERTWCSSATRENLNDRSYHENANSYHSFISEENLSKSNAQMHTEILRKLNFEMTVVITRMPIISLIYISEENLSKSNAQMHTELLRKLNSRFALEHRYT